MIDALKVAGKRVVITGGATNIGRATAQLLGAYGARLVIGDLNAEGAEACVRDIEDQGGEASFVRTDVTDEESVARLIDTAAERLGGLDAGFFNAGLMRSGAVTEFDTSDWDALFRVNPRHCFLGAKYITPHLKAVGGRGECSPHRWLR